MDDFKTHTDNNWSLSTTGPQVCSPCFVQVVWFWSWEPLKQEIKSLTLEATALAVNMTTAVAFQSHDSVYSIFFVITHFDQGLNSSQLALTVVHWLSEKKRRKKSEGRSEEGVSDKVSDWGMWDYQTTKNEVKINCIFIPVLKMNYKFAEVCVNILKWDLLYSRFETTLLISEGI